MKNLYFVFFFSFVFFINIALSNNIQVSTVSLTGQVKASHYAAVQFNMSWDNSWRDVMNFDAAWVFVKYKASYDSVWKHATLSTTNTNHTVPTGFTRSVSSDGKGIFVYRNAEGSGSNSLTGVQLRWMYGTDGVGDNDLVTVKVFAIEMVYIPEGSFYAGDGYTTDYGQFSQGNTDSPFLISSEASLTLGGILATNLGNRNSGGMAFTDDFNSGITQTLPAAFPKGYNDFFCMKYEVSQGQYTDFLNTLSRWQQRSRVVSDISGDAVTNIYVMSNSSSLVYRNKIICPASGNGTTQPVVFSCDRQDRACNYLNWPDGCAYMDWTGLRPLTDLEFEKVCRGPLTPVPGEYAWGNTSFTSLSNITGPENGTEVPSTISQNVSYGNLTYSGTGDGGQGPVRCGIFARPSTTRQQAGATYWGVMEMSGNVYERPVTLGNTTGRLFDGLHGDGELSVNGNGDVSTWPGIVAGEITGATGSGLKLGSWVINLIYYNMISSRSSSNANNIIRNYSYGFRGGHTAPTGVVTKIIPEEKNINK